MYIYNLQSYPSWNEYTHWLDEIGGFAYNVPKKRKSSVKIHSTGLYTLYTI